MRMVYSQPDNSQMNISFLTIQSSKSEGRPFASLLHLLLLADNICKDPQVNSCNYCEILVELYIVLPLLRKFHIKGNSWYFK